MNKHKNQLSLYILGLFTAVIMVALDVVLVTIIGLGTTLGIEDPLELCAGVFTLVGNLMTRVFFGLPVWLLFAIGSCLLLAIASFFIGGYFKRNQELLKIKTYDKNKNKQTLTGIAGVKRPELTNFWVGAAKVYLRSLLVTFISAVALSVFLVLAFLALVPVITVISKSGSLSGFSLVLCAGLALVSVWVVLFVFVLLKIYMIGLYRGMIMYSDKFFLKSLNSVNSVFMRKYTDYLMMTILYLGLRVLVLWVCTAFANQLAKANVMMEIYILDGFLKVGYLLLVNRTCIGDQ